MAGRPPVNPVIVATCTQCGYLTANQKRVCTRCLNFNDAKRRAIHAVRSMLPADHPGRRGPVH